MVVGNFWGGVGVRGPIVDGDEMVGRMRKMHPLLLDSLAPGIIVGKGGMGDTEGVGDMVMFPDGDSKLLTNIVHFIYTGRWVIESCMNIVKIF